MSTLNTQNIDSDGDLKLKSRGTLALTATANGDIQVARYMRSFMYQSDQFIDENYTIEENKSCMSIGPIELDDGVAITVSSGSRWVVL